MNRRSLLGSLLAPAFVRAEESRPQITHGVQSGDPDLDSALVWVRGDRPSRMCIEVATDEQFRKVIQRIRGPHVLESNDYTARHVLSGLPSGADLHYRVTLEDLRESRALSAPVAGHLRTASMTPRNLRFLWSGDMVGQGYGINPDRGGIQMFSQMLSRQPDFFLHSGDTIYADSPCPSEFKTPDGVLWKNLVTEAKSRVAETLTDFRGCYQYNLLDENVKRFNAQVTQVWQWDDHEVLNNWSPSKDLSKNNLYGEKSIALLASRAGQAFREYAPMRRNAVESERVYRKISYGPLLDVFLIDMRSYRAGNSYNRQETESDETTFLGAEQRAWLKRELKASRAAWKVIGSDMPIGLLVGDGKDAAGRPVFEAVANGPGPVLGRELEIADLLRYLKQEKIRNTVWLTADVHYTAAHHYHPSRASFQDFDPFWEFVSGPMNAGTGSPGTTDPSFGIDVVFSKGAEKGKSNASPAANLQFFGEVEIDARTKELTVTLRDVTGAGLFTQRLRNS
ncbi:alkaline phosphatase D family protein [Bryobacter aggregatus]|uniref:alkaline phosphatase D family protein n=1 Tax=Bryobacter aggregatus TaxID=360054 RepID=UPI0004E1B33D|nr:alkaline phosphatase D family protein [Bryobacter aggregatus]